MVHCDNCYMAFTQRSPMLKKYCTVLFSPRSHIHPIRKGARLLSAQRDSLNQAQHMHCSLLFMSVQRHDAADSKSAESVRLQLTGVEERAKTLAHLWLYRRLFRGLPLRRA